MSEMKSKTDLHAALARLSAEQQEQANALIVEAETLRSRIAPIDQESRALSKQIGQAKKNGEDAKLFLEQKKTLSLELDRLKHRLDEIEASLQAIFNSTSEEQLAAASELPRYRWAQYMPVSVHPLSADLEKAWDNYVHTHPAASIYHLVCWKTVIEKAFGHPAIYLFARDDKGAICGVLPMIRLTSRIFGDFVVSIPYFNYGGALGEHPEVEQALLEKAAELAAEMGVKHVEWRDDVARHGYPAREDKVAMILRLPATEDALWQQLGTKLRAQIKKPQKENHTVCIGGEELLNDFYEVFATNMRDLGTPVYAKHFFSIILKDLGSKARLMVIKHAGRPVSAAFLLGYREQLEIPWASTIREANHLSMNMLLYWNVLCFAIKQGYKRFDFGRSTRDAGTFKFKAQWGAQPKQLYWHYWLPAGHELPRLNPDNPKFKLAIAVWQQLPIWLTKLIGPPVVKFLP